MVTGAPTPYMMGGEYNSGPAKGDYHVVVADAQNGEAKTGRPQLTIELIVKDDPNHAAKEGKKLSKMFQCYPMESDDPEKAKNMKGMWKRLIYDGFGLKWPTDEKPLDPRALIGKQAWVRMGDTKGANGEPRVGITHVAQTPESLPTQRTNGAARSGGTASAAPAASSGRRR